MHPVDEWPRLLVVDPDEERRRELSCVLEERYGPDTVLMAGTAQDALAVVAGATPPVSVLLTPARQAPDSGVALLREVRRRFPDLARALVAAPFRERPADYADTEVVAGAVDEGLVHAVVIWPVPAGAERPFRGLDDLLDARRRPVARDPDERGVHDVVVVGGGPAGVAAAVHAASDGLATVVVEAGGLGGQAGTSGRIDNYPGFPAGISGAALMERAGEQAARLGAGTVLRRRVVSLGRDESGLLVVGLADGEEMRGRAVVLASGVQYRRLGIPSVERLVGAGVHYGSPTVELPGIRGGRVYVVGGGEAAGQAALRMAETAAAVSLVVRRPSPFGAMSRRVADRVAASPAVRVLTSVEVVGAVGTSRLSGLRLRDSFGDLTAVPADALLVLIGADPRTGWLPPEVRRDRQGYVLTGGDLTISGRPLLPLETSMPGVFAVGDVRHRSIKRVAAAVGDGATVVSSVQAYLADSETGSGTG
ncbi:MAG: FAD-dependent oxidoreductase [Kineosporiaceae bacterium]